MNLNLIIAQTSKLQKKNWFTPYIKIRYTRDALWEFLKKLSNVDTKTPR